MASPKTTEPIKPNCRYCKNGGKVENHMCMCSVLNVNRAAVSRICAPFELDKIKYNQFKTEKSC